MRTSSDRTRRLFQGALAFILIALPAAAQAGDYRPPQGDIDQRLRELEEEVRELKAERARQAAPAAEAVDKSELDRILDEKFKSQKVLAGWNDGFFLQSPSGDFKLKLRGYVQADTRFFVDAKGDTGFDNFSLRRVRPIVEGTVYKYFDFRIMPDFGGGTTVLQDAYMDVKYWPAVSFRFGKTKVPLSLERLQSGSDILFVERALSQNLAPNRDVGFMVYGDVLGNGTVNYQAGVFNGVFDGGIADNDVSSAKDAAGRLWFEPFKATDIEPLQKLGVGFAGTWGRQSDDDLSGLSFKTTGRSTFFRFDPTIKPIAKGDHYRWSPQAYYYFGPFGVMGEYIYTDQEVSGTFGVAPAPGEHKRRDVRNHGWFAQASWVITGEDASYKGVTPINNFDPANGRWGAFEVAGRISNVDLENAVIRQKIATGVTEAWEYTGGLNWYLNRAFKFQLNYAHTDFSQKATFSGEKRDHEDVIQTRFQLSY